jgi:hypothetical protein
MARTVTHAAVALALLATLSVLAACGTPAPSSDRPAWLPSSPVDPPRIPAPERGFRA